MANWKFQLVTKVCKSPGCEMSWRALENSPNQFCCRAHSQELYLPWRTERAKFRTVRKWLLVKFGAPEEKETDQEVLSQIEPDEITI
jgi:hypothetical protein